MENPKLAGSQIVDAIPHTGECPNRCSECFYNGGRFYRPLDAPLLPNPEEVGSRIVRVNSGHDSNVDREMVVAATGRYVRRFFNTAIPRLDFPGPVVLTINPQRDKGREHLVPNPPRNLMFVRVRTGLDDETLIRRVLDNYGPHGVPVVATFMRYYDEALVPKECADGYEWKSHILNAYHCPKTEAVIAFMARFKGTGLLMCGTPYSSMCADCGNCERLYWRAVRRMQAF